MKNNIRLIALIAVLFMMMVSTQAIAVYQKITFPDACHPALISAAQIMAEKLGVSNTDIQAAVSKGIPENGQILFAVAPLTDLQKEWAGDVNTADYDGYIIVFRDGAALICGNRPRSFLYAAGDVHLCKNRTEGIYKRQPSFALRTTEHHGNMPIPKYVAAMGMNLLIDRRMKTTVSFRETLPKVYKKLSTRDQQRMSRLAERALHQKNNLKQACHDADIEYYAFLYGNNFKLWSDVLYKAALKAYPSVQGTPPANSWEQATLCPSDPMTWKLIDAYLREYMAQTKADGLYITYWDNYGIYCQCDRCKANGMNEFPNQLYACVRQYHETIKSLGKKLIVRTWSSGVPHWLRDQWVHAPGYDHFGGSGFELWGRVFKELPAEIIIQTKVYHADCEPAPRFTTLLGKAAPHQEIAEYQMTGQTTGRYYFPASTVNHTAWTMKKSHELIGPDAGVNLYLGGTRQTNYFLLNDILNSINVYAWRELSWDVDVDMNKVWSDWAIQVYGEKAAPYMARAIRLSEDAVNGTFSTLGMGSSTNSDFVKTISRRETLLMYTNRHFLPEYAKYLEPTKENIQRVIDEKDECLNKIDQMYAEFNKAKPYLTEAQVKEIQTRFDWMKEFAIIKRYLEESLFRFRYLRYLNSMRTTDPSQIKYLEQAFDQVRRHQKNLFQYNPDLKFQCYDTTLGNLQRKPSLGSPISLMKELYDQSKMYVEEIVGPHYLTQMKLKKKKNIDPEP